MRVGSVSAQLRKAHGAADTERVHGGPRVRGTLWARENAHDAGFFFLSLRHELPGCDVPSVWSSAVFQLLQPVSPPGTTPASSSTTSSETH